MGFRDSDCVSTAASRSETLRAVTSSYKFIYACTNSNIHICFACFTKLHCFSFNEIQFSCTVYRSARSL